MKLSARKTRRLIREERRSAKMYRKYGFRKIAKEESKHARILQRRLKRG